VAEASSSRLVVRVSVLFWMAWVLLSQVYMYLKRSPLSIKLLLGREVPGILEWVLRRELGQSVLSGFGFHD
jgi:hypothetical protein